MNTNDDGLTKWLKELNVNDAPVPRLGLHEALTFFHTRMPTLPRKMRLAFLKAMDLGKPVRSIWLHPPTQLAAFRKCNEDPFKFFYTKVGTGMQYLALNPKSRGFMRYNLRIGVQVLESICISAIDTWTDDRNYFWGRGGGTQYIIPESYRYLLIALP